MKLIIHFQDVSQTFGLDKTESETSIKPTEEVQNIIEQDQFSEHEVSRSEQKELETLPDSKDTQTNNETAAFSSQGATEPTVVRESIYDIVFLIIIQFTLKQLKMLIMK